MTVYIILKRLYDSWVPEGHGFVMKSKADDYCKGNHTLDYKSITIEGKICLD